jgi:uncharacterized protein (TIGR01777 family)
MAETTGRALLLTGATGLVGRRLRASLVERYDDVRLLSRSASDGAARPAGSGERRLQWDGVDPGPEALAGAEAIVHLAGEPVFGGLPSAARRKRIRDSRIDSTRALVRGLAALTPAERPATLVCASAVGLYGDRGEELLDERARPGTGFLAQVCMDWEAEARAAAELGVRVVSLRIGVVLSADGGALALMRVPFGLGLGGRLGDGEQFFAWIHLDDLVGVIVWALEGEVEGPVNAVAPESVRNVELTRALARRLRRPARLPVPGFVLRAVLGEMAGELLGSRRVVPRVLEEAGFAFRHPELEEALAAELG